MAHRPIIDKRVKRMRRTLTKGRLPAFFDLADYLIERGHAKTVGEAYKLILREKVKADSHVLGIHELELPNALGRPVLTRVVYRRVPVELKSRVVVSA